MARKKVDKATPVLNYKHQDKRCNIPTHELRDFVAEYETAPQSVLYPRDPSLDPQLVWKGKDEQDRESLIVPAVPVYIQEKILPKAIIEEVRAQSQESRPEAQVSLFDDFNGIAFEQMVDFYRHEQNWSNRLILGDSLLVMTSLAEKEGLKGQVQMIYVDPPYGIKFGSNWQVSTRKREVKDGKAEDLTRQPEQIRAYRDTWKLGIHSYLAYLRDRLVVARELLTETGSIFVQIGDENVHLVRCLLDEVFGSENFCSMIQVQKTGGQASEILASTVDFLLWYARRKELVKYRQLYAEREVGDLALSRYDYTELPDGTERRLSPQELARRSEVSEKRIFQYTSLISEGQASSEQDFLFRDVLFTPKAGSHWKTTSQGLDRLASAGRISQAGRTVRYKRFLRDFPVIPIHDRWESMQIGTELIYVVQTSAKVVERCLLMTTDAGDLVLDPTCGSGTTAYVAEQWGRRWITIDTSRVALALTRTRLMAARFPYYTLADSPEGLRKEAEFAGKVPSVYQMEGDIKKGFIYKRVPHITLKSIANNEEIDAIHTRWREKLEPVRLELNKLLKQSWEEWQIPRETDKPWPAKAKDLLSEWWSLRQQRQEEIDASIARRADTELLYDEPYEDKKRIRVTGPLTVESLAPHRVLTPDMEIEGSAVEAHREAAVGQFEAMILDNLRKAGVQNTRKNERLMFDQMEPYAGEWLHAEGQYTEQEGAVKRAAVCIGPEHGTVGPELVKEAAKEAVKGIGFDLLIVCGFAFDPHVSEEVKRYGKLTVLAARMNPDLAMGDELLKKTGAGNLFMVFGEPDIEIRTQKDGQVVAEIRGLDIYDPTTGQIRSSSTDDIACWFIDTNYNGESFFVRHAYFTGADRPYDKLKRALRAEIDETAWSALYSTVSRPFPKPLTGKIAVKVINHYGDEVLKVFEV
jgi:adenine-specific DNA-methyltransferase